jgi:nucleoside-diphosphate-sugar epimerase
MPLPKIALIGANGTLGPAILSALLGACYPVTVLSRSTSKSNSTYPSTVSLRSIPSSPTKDDYITALSGQDVLITTFAGTNASLQITLADACVAAGVKRFIPADFGSCDSSSPLALKLMPLYQGKKEVREYLQSLARAGKLSWTSLVTGHFFDYGLASGLLLMDLNKKKIVMVDGGQVLWSTSTLERVGEAVVAILRNEEKTRDKMLYIQSFSISQRKLLEVCEKVQGQKWDVEEVKSGKFMKEMKKRIDEGEDHEATENLVGVVGIIDGDWRRKDGFANEMLGLKEGDLEGEVRKVIEGQKKD